VQETTMVDYERRVLWIQSRLDARGVSWYDAPLVDDTLCALLEELYFEGYDGGEAGKLMAAWSAVHPEYGPHGTLLLPHAARAAKGFRRLAPSRSRAPLPLAFACAIAMCALHERRFEEALMWLVMFVAYLRPSEALTLLCRHVLRPAPSNMGIELPTVTLLIRPMECSLAESSRPSKTGAFDDSVPLDMPYLQEAPMALTRLAQSRPGEARLFQTSYEQMKQDLTLRCRQAGLGSLHVTTYCFRHGGPSHDRAAGLRDLSQILKRGRWAALASVKRYEKAGRVQAALNSAPAPAVEYARSCLEALGPALLGLRRPLRPPPCLLAL